MSTDAGNDALVSAPHESRVQGALLAAACGDALGACVEGWAPADIQERYADGLASFQRSERGYGCYTDDTEMMIALTRSLVKLGRCDAVHAAKAYAKECHGWRGYGQTAIKVLRDIKEGEDHRVACTRYLPNGSFGNGGAMRIAPVGIAYRHAPTDVLHAAVVSAVECTHVHPIGIDGAFIQAAAVAFLCQSPLKWRADGTAPRELLLHLRGLARTPEMQGRLDTLLAQWDKLAALGAPAHIGPTGWRDYFDASAWTLELETCSAVAQPFQIEASQAVSCALAALVFHWLSPEDAVVAAVHYGGDTDTIACMTGAMAGALHGRMWVPERWFSALENGPEDGRDHLLGLAHKLAALDVRT